MLKLVSMAILIVIGSALVPDDGDCRPLAADLLKPCPVDQIPKLPLFRTGIDYRTALASETIAPDRITIDSMTVSTGMPEPVLVARLGKKFEILEKPQHRTREDQWRYVCSMATRHSNSMHYHILSEIHYDRQLYGWFKAYRWNIEGVGELTAFLNAQEADEIPTVWLFHLALDAVPTDEVIFLKDRDGLVLSREGVRHSEWNVDRNVVKIDACTSETEVQRQLSSSAIFEGFYWKTDPPSQNRILDLTREQVKTLTEALSRYRAELSPHGWYPGIPDRTLLLVEEGLRIVYGGSMGDEIGIAGTEKGFFRSYDFLNLLFEIEGREREH